VKRSSRKRRWIWTGLLLVVAAMAFPRFVRGDAEVDPGLVGEWWLQGTTQPIIWTIREDGTYEVSAPNLKHSGRFTAARGEWSLQSPTWGEDGGSYRVSSADSFVGTGKLGPATWVRTQRQAAADASGAASRAERPTMSKEAQEQYIADYNAQWERAAAGLRRLTTRPARGSSEPIVFGDSSSPSSGSSGDSGPTPEQTRQEDAASRAYWESPEAYNRIQSGGCTWSDSSRYGC
jgi:hypothetical protein